MLGLAIFIFGGAWAFFLALMLDRADLLVKLNHALQMKINLVFICLYVLALAKLTWPQIYYSHLTFMNVIRIISRNVFVMVAGMILLIYISRMLLDGIDHTHHHALW